MPRNLLLLYPVIGAVVCLVAHLVARWKPKLHTGWMILAALVGFGVSLPNALAKAHKKC